MKLKYALIEKLHILTRRELHLFLYICQIQNDYTGTVDGLHYRDVVGFTGMCKQSVYNSLRSLEDKGMIDVSRSSKIDFDICIPGNAFPDRDALKEGYVNLNRKAFRTAMFRKLKAHEIYLLLEFLKCTHEGSSSMVRNVEDLYDRMQKLLGVTERVIRSYLHSMRQFFSIGIKNGKYYITYLHSAFKLPKPGEEKAEIDWYREHIVEEGCRRSRTAYTEKAFDDVKGLLRTYKPDEYQGIGQRLMESIAKSVEGIRQKERSLNPKYVHKLLREALGLPESEESRRRKEEERARKRSKKNFENIMKHWNDPEPV